MQLNMDFSKHEKALLSAARVLFFATDLGLVVYFGNKQHFGTMAFFIGLGVSSFIWLVSTLKIDW